MIALQQASRWYGQVIGINDVSCLIPAGLTALLGPNGAGKSTLLKLVTGQMKPTAGRVTVLGQAPFANSAVYRKVGYCPESESSYDDMTGYDFVALMAAMTAVPSSQLQQRVTAVIERVGMTANAGRKIGGYSKGMRQRIKLAQGIVHNPDILILDEPMNGLDPQARNEVSALLTQLAADGKCVVVSSHILYEVEHLTHSILLMHRGRLLAQGDIYQIRSLIDAHPHRIAITASAPRRLAKLLLDLPYVLSVKFDDGSPNSLEIETRSPDVFYSHFPEVILDSDLQVSSFESPDNNLESVFKYLVSE